MPRKQDKPTRPKCIACIKENKKRKMPSVYKYLGYVVDSPYCFGHMQKYDMDTVEEIRDRARADGKDLYKGKLVTKEEKELLEYKSLEKKVSSRETGSRRSIEIFSLRDVMANINLKIEELYSDKNYFLKYLDLAMRTLKANGDAVTEVTIKYAPEYIVPDGTKDIDEPFK
jgi:hypothetical protein